MDSLSLTVWFVVCGARRGGLPLESLAIPYFLSMSANRITDYGDTVEHGHGSRFD
jgi:hypothetical protein